MHINFGVCEACSTPPHSPALVYGKETWPDMAWVSASLNLASDFVSPSTTILSVSQCENATCSNSPDSRNEAKSTRRRFDLICQRDE